MTFKADMSVDGALVQADFCLDTGDDAGAARWVLTGRIQEAALALWEKFGAAWTPTQLRTLSMSWRTRWQRVEANGVSHVLAAWFAANEVVFTLYVADPNGKVRTQDGNRHTLVRSRAVRRKTVVKNGQTAALRGVAVSLAG